MNGAAEEFHPSWNRGAVQNEVSALQQLASFRKRAVTACRISNIRKRESVKDCVYASSVPVCAHFSQGSTLLNIYLCLLWMENFLVFPEALFTLACLKCEVICYIWFFAFHNTCTPVKRENDQITDQNSLSFFFLTPPFFFSSICLINDEKFCFSTKTWAVFSSFWDSGQTEVKINIIDYWALRLFEYCSVLLLNTQRVLYFGSIRISSSFSFSFCQLVFLLLYVTCDLSKISEPFVRLVRLFQCSLLLTGVIPKPKNYSLVISHSYVIYICMCLVLVTVA